jgi:hypothetical protein
MIRGLLLVVVLLAGPAWGAGTDTGPWDTVYGTFDTVLSTFRATAEGAPLADVVAR